MGKSEVADGVFDVVVTWLISNQRPGVRFPEDAFRLFPLLSVFDVVVTWLITNQRPGVRFPENAY